MKESVVSDACVMPSTSGSATAGFLPSWDAAGVLVHEAVLVHLLAHQEGGIARIEDVHLLEHLADNDLDMLVIDVDALETVHVLDFFHQVVGKVLFTLDLQDVVQFGVALGEQLARFHEVAVGHGDMASLGNEVFLEVAGLRGDDDLAFALGVRAKGDDAVDFGHNTLVLGFADFEKLGNPRQAADDVLGLRGFARLTGNDVARAHFVAVAHHDDRAHRQLEHGVHVRGGALLHLALFIHDGDGGLERGGAVLDDGLGGALGRLVHLFLVGLAFHDVGELGRAFHVRDKTVR